MTSSINYVPKGWGYEKWIVNKKEYCGKLLFIQKGKRCSWHYHKLKDETFYLQSGKIMLYYFDSDDFSSAKELVLNPGDKFYVYPGLRHQMFALEDSDLFEFSTEHFDEDSYRVIKGD
jgi:quercetin dioxygenase-like cupin family protein